MKENNKAEVLAMSTSNQVNVGIGQACEVLARTLDSQVSMSLREAARFGARLSTCLALLDGSMSVDSTQITLRAERERGEGDDRRD